MNSMEASKSSDFGLYPNRSAIALWCNWKHIRLLPSMQAKGPVDLLVADSEVTGSKSPLRFGRR